MNSEADISALTSDGSLNISSDFASDTSLCEDRLSSSWNTTTDSRDNSISCLSESDADRLKRGRPRADQITSLIVSGAKRESAIRCKICRRVFPREKSLQAHMRTHTGERPYLCDYPDCGKAFCQSGQLKTHQRLHTGEKPFVCTVAGCESRFTHANRHCADHPTAGLKRQDSRVAILQLIKEDTRPEVALWLQRQANMRVKTPSRCESKDNKSTGTPGGCTKRSLKDDMENQWVVHKRSRLSGVSDSPTHDEKPADIEQNANVVFINYQQQQTNLPLLEQQISFLNSEQSKTAIKSEKVTSSDTVTVCSVAVKETSVVKHTFQVRKDHQLPIQRLLKPEEYEAIRSSPKKRFPLSPIRSSPRRVPFSPKRSSFKENSAQTIKSKAQIALFASPPPKCSENEEPFTVGALMLSPMVNGSPLSNASPMSQTVARTPNRRMSPRKFFLPSHSTPVRSSPKKFASPALKRSASPRKYHLYTTPSPINSHRVQSPRKSNLFAARLGSQVSPIKRASPVKLFSSPSYQKGIRMSPRKALSPRHPGPVGMLKELSPLKQVEAGENSEKLMGALALMELAGGL